MRTWALLQNFKMLLAACVQHFVSNAKLCSEMTSSSHLIWLQLGSQATMQARAWAASKVVGLLGSSNSPTSGSTAPCCPKAMAYSKLL